MRLETRSLFHPRVRGTYKIEAKAETEATIYLYDEISWFGIRAADFVKDLAAVEARTIHLRVNSPGGSVFDGMAIHTALKEHPAKVIAHVDGLAASIASVIVMAADEIRMAEPAFLMIHEPWSMVVGSAEDLRKEAELLDKVAGQIAGIFRDRSGATDDQVLDWMAAETWFTAVEAKDAGFADAVEANNGAKARAQFDLSAFAHTPEALKDREPPTERDLERVLRDAGCSRSEAKSILADGVKGRQRDAAAPEPAAPAPPRDVADAGPPEPPREAASPVPKDVVAALLGRVDIHLATTRPEPKEQTA